MPSITPNSENLKFVPSAKFLRERSVMIIADCPLDNEIKADRGFSSQTAQTLFAALSKQSIRRTQIHTAYCFNFRPPKGNISSLFYRKGLPIDQYKHWPDSKNDHILDYAYTELCRLREEIHQVKPQIILLIGRYATYFLTGEPTFTQTKKSEFGVLLKYRASYLKATPWWELDKLEKPYVCMPILTPATEWKLPDKQYLIRQDYVRAGMLNKALAEGNFKKIITHKTNYITAPTLEQVKEVLTNLLIQANSGELRLACDVETRNGYQDCVGIAWDKINAVCIPFATQESPHYWTHGEEETIYPLLYELFTHKNVKHIGQNYSYDMQYFLRDLAISVEAHFDTMTMHHTLLPGAQKSLDILASLHCKYYRFWKDDGKTHLGASDVQRWVYNCDDCTNTFEIAEALEKIIKNSPENIQEAYRFQQYDVQPAITRMMYRGIRVDIEEKEKLYKELSEIVKELYSLFQEVIGEEINCNSSAQMQALFYDLFAQPKQFDPKTNAVTVGKQALINIKEEEPLLSGIIDLYLEYKGLEKFTNTFLKAGLDEDKRMRCSYSITGTDTFRLSSSKNAFDSGMNLQNIPAGGTTTSGRQLPNVKHLFMADEGYTMYDSDFDSADLRIVVAESGCKNLQALLDEGKKVYVELMRDYYRDNSLTKKSPMYRTFKAIAHGCLTKDHEVLTKNGWVSVDKMVNEPIAIWDNWKISFETPITWLEKAVNEVYEVSGKAFYQLCSSDHKFIGTTDSLNNLREYKAHSLPSSIRIPYTGNLTTETGLDLTKNEVILLAALQADGSIKYKDLQGHLTIQWRFVKERKISRLCTALEALEIPYRIAAHGKSSSGNVITAITVNSKDCFLQEYMKYLDWWILDYGPETLHNFSEELLLWDGSIAKDTSNRKVVCTTDKKAAEIIHTINHLTGKGSKITATARDESRKTLYRVSQNSRRFHSVKTGAYKKREVTSTKVYCPTVSSGYFLTRCKGHISVSGNSHYAGSAAGLAKRTGLLVHEVDKLQKDYFAMNPEIRVWQKELEKQIKQRGWIENIFGFRKYFLNRRLPTLLQVACAWKPQSSIAILVNKGLVNLEKNYPDILPLMQVHDSLVVQASDSRPNTKRDIITSMEIELPYENPITIPVDCVSGKRWSECK